jgi:N-acetylglucosaminyl-diphospho-decaprenol L-rhamnosyltransferase
MLTVSILNYKSWLETEQCVRDLCAACPGLELRILIRDNSKTSEVELLRAALADLTAPIEYFRSPENPGFARGHNLSFAAVAHGDDDWFLILNPDVRIRDGAPLYSMMERCAPNVIASCVIESTGSGKIWFAGGRIHPWTGETRILRRSLSQPYQQTDFVTGCCMMMRAALYRRLRGFDDRYFMYSEDVDLCLRARALSAAAVVVRSRIQHHIGSGEKGDYSDLYLYEGTKNRLLCMRRNRLGIIKLGMLYMVLKYGLLRSAQLLARSTSPWRQIRAAWRGVFDGLHQS